MVLHLEARQGSKVAVWLQRGQQIHEEIEASRALSAYRVKKDTLSRRVQAARLLSDDEMASLRAEDGALLIPSLSLPRRGPRGGVYSLSRRERSILGCFDWSLKSSRGAREWQFGNTAASSSRSRQREHKYKHGDSDMDLSELGVDLTSASWSRTQVLDQSSSSNSENGISSLKSILSINSSGGDSMNSSLDQSSSLSDAHYSDQPSRISDSQLHSSNLRL
jgi:hypothetical protein